MRGHAFTGWAALAALLCWGATASSLPAQGEVHRLRLENGLRVLVLPRTRWPLVHLTTLYGVGSAQESPGITGIAHFVEHMNFRATENISREDITGFIDRIGGRWNGYTSLEQTLYGASVPSWALEELVRREAERMNRALFEPLEFERERLSVIAELQSYENDPLSILWDLALATSFEIHPYRYNIIGWLSDVLSVSRDRAYSFYRDYYGPNNAVMAVVGDTSPQEVERLIRRHFASLPPAPLRGKVPVREPPQRGEKRVTLLHPGSREHLLMVFRAPSAREAEYAVLLVLDSFLGGGRGFLSLPGPRRVNPGSPLQEALSAVGATAGYTALTPTRDPYVFAIGVSFPAEVRAARVEEAIWLLLRKIQEEGVEDEERKRAVERIRTANLLAHRSVAEEAHRLAYFELLDSWDSWNRLEEAISQVSSRDIQDFVKRRMGPTQVTVAYQRKGAALQPLLGRLPEPPPPPPPVTPSPVPRRALESLSVPLEQAGRSLSNGAWAGGLRGYSPAAALHLRLAWGSRRDAPGQEGLSLLAFRVLSSHPSLQAFLRKSGARWESSAEDSLSRISNWEVLDWNVVVPEHHRAELLHQVRLALEGPWPEERIRREKARLLEEVEALQESPEWRALEVALQLWSAEAFPPFGKGESLAALSPRDVQGFLQEKLRGGSIWMSLVAPAPAVELVRQLEGILERLPAGERLPLNPPWKSVSGGDREVEVAGVTQASLRGILPAPPCSHPDHLPLRLLNFVLGETGYAGRLGDALVDSGLAYSVYASPPCLSGPGPLLLETATAASHREAARSAIRDVITRLQEEGISEQELQAAQAFFLGRSLLKLEREEQLARELVQAAYLGEGGLELETLSRRVLSLTLPEVNRVARTYLDPGRLSLGTAVPPQGSPR